MTPGKELLYFLTTLIVFIALLTWWENDEPAVTAPVALHDQKVDSSSLKPQPAAIVFPDTLAKANSSTLDSGSFVKRIPLVFSETDSLHLSGLQAKLTHLSKSSLPLRIVYFGDSQIENDRITGALRKELQAVFGGRGPGFIALDSYYSTNHQLIIETSDSWEVKTFQDPDFKSKSILFKHSILTKDRGWFRIRRIKRLSLKPDYSLMKLYYTANDSCQIEVRDGKKLIYQGSLPPHKQVSTLDFRFNQTPEDIRVDFNVKDSLSVTGLSLESETGVLVDNVALRGLSYPEFLKSDQEVLQEMLGQVDVGMFVLHFGVNLVPYQSKDYRHFKTHFQQQLSFLKAIRPEVPILLVGVSDMAQRQGDHFQSYGTIPKIKQVQQELALENHTAFWDLEAAMGGAGAMVKWVQAQPALGRKDYVHFSREGARLIGKEMAQLILNELSQEKDTISHDESLAAYR